MPKNLTIKDKDGVVTIEEMRVCFEKAVKDTPLFAKSTPLGIMQINGKFHHYMDPDTDTMWIGFAIGMRCAERIVGRLPPLTVLIPAQPSPSPQSGTTES